MKTKESYILASKAFVCGFRNPTSINNELQDFKKCRVGRVIKPMTPPHQKHRDDSIKKQGE